jgi:hypothetical protein
VTTPGVLLYVFAFGSPLASTLRNYRGYPTMLALMMRMTPIDGLFMPLLFHCPSFFYRGQWGSVYISYQMFVILSARGGIGCCAKAGPGCPILSHE